MQDEKLKAEAWLIRQLKGPNRDQVSVLYGHMFKSEEAANAAAFRLTNGWRLCLPFPVVSLGNALSTPPNTAALVEAGERFLVKIESLIDVPAGPYAIRNSIYYSDEFKALFSALATHRASAPVEGGAPLGDALRRDRETRSTGDTLGESERGD